MSVFVKGAGGGKSEGLYVWKKYSAVIDIGPTVSAIALVNDGTYVYVYTKDQLYIEDGTIKIYQDAPLLVEISSVYEASMIGGTPLYCMGIDGNVYYCPRPNNSGSVDSCMANLVVVNKGDFIDYAVSDNESKYPDGGTQDGYWYEKVVEGVTGIDYGTVTVSGIMAITINHNLGEVPKRVFVWASVNSGSKWSLFTSGTDKIGAYYEITMYYNTFGGQTDKSSIGFTGTTTTFTLDGSNAAGSVKFNGTYNWIAIA